MDIMKMGKNPNYLGSWDVEETPKKELILTIEKIVDEEVVTNGKSEVCTVAHFTDKAYKPMIFNITNMKRLCKLYKTMKLPAALAKTKETDKLKGKAVVIGIEKVKAFGDVHDALRIKPRIPESVKAASVKCEACGNDISAYGSMTPEQVAAYTLKQYGKKLCIDCGAKAKGAKE